MAGRGWALLPPTVLMVLLPLVVAPDPVSLTGRVRLCQAGRSERGSAARGLGNGSRDARDGGTCAGPRSSRFYGL